MPDVINFYMDDSGTRHPDKHPGEIEHNDWFALGGVLIAERDEGDPRDRHERFCAHWGIKYPLHSYEIRHGAGNFQWLSRISQRERIRFFRQLERLLLPVPVIGLACVIDRPGYNTRYRAKYAPRDRWWLCKSAFSILVERAVKFARSRKHKLRVLPEKCSPTDDAKLRQYYEQLRSSGQPFDSGTSNRYQPLKSETFADTLYEFRLKSKTSPMIQLADLYLWPMCQGGYDATYDPYCKLIRAQRLMDTVCPQSERESLGIKYYCFDTVRRKTA
jgi:hypothetical protein